MTDGAPITLDQLDRDEALLDAIAELHGPTRAELLRKAALGSAAMLAALAAPAAAGAATRRAAGDLEILNFGLRFERLQATFYTEAVTVGTVDRMSAAKQLWADTLGAHERAHVRILRKILGSQAEPRPFFDFGGVTETEAGFTRTAVAMEDLTVALLTGVAPRMRDRSLSAALFTLLTTEARHAAWARHIVGSNPSAHAFDEPRSLEAVGRVVAKTRFIVSNPRLRSRKRNPRFTG